MIKEVKTYVDEKGREVHVLFNVDENLETSKDLTTVLCKGSFAVMSNMGPMRMSIDFPEKYSVNQCFEEFDKFAQEVIDEKQKEIQEQSKIAVPNKKGGIIIP